MNRKITRHRFLILGLLAGCSGESSQGLDSQELTRVEEAGPDEACQNGGVVVSSGSDTNKDGKLDDDEIVGEPVVVCSGDTRADPDNPQLLTRVDALPLGSVQCPAGGVAIHTGLDDDGNALLSDPEIDQTQLVCEHPVLTRAVAIPVGSSECIYGGQRIEAGADDGGGGMGVANNAVLDDGEVDTSYISCNASPPVRGEPLTPPAEPVGTATIDLRGGNANAALAGAGGQLSMPGDTSDQCVPAVTKLATTGVADASFTAPTLTLDLGANPFVVSSATTLQVREDALAPVIGQYYYASANSQIVRWSGRADEVVTGLRIEAGAILTMPRAQAALQFTRDVEVLGTLTLASGARALQLGARQLVVSSAGVIDATPIVAGRVNRVTLAATSQLVFQGNLLAQGGATGVPGSPVSLGAQGRVVVEGKIDASGADSTTVGGAGGTVRVIAQSGGVWNAAEIDATGGDGLLGGGPGGAIVLGNDQVGSRPLDLRNRGLLDASGGVETGTTCLTGQCSGGAGGVVQLLATLASLTSSGELRANGGSGPVAVGAGGSISASVLSSVNAPLPDARLSLSGSILAAGGTATSSGAPGGQGGGLTLRNCTGQSSVAELLGYQTLQAQGGSATGVGAGGQGGAVSIQSFVDVPTPRRLLVNVPMNLGGGSGYGGGPGGLLQLELSSANVVVGSELPEGFPSLIIAGDHNLAGGNATDGSGSAGQAGSALLATRGDLTSSGSLTASGGSGSSEEIVPGGGSIVLRSALGSVRNSATLSADGADALNANNEQGGYGGCISIEAQAVQNSAALSAHGGDGAVGGEGGTIALHSQQTLGQNSGTLDVQGGAGTPAGSAGLAGFDIPNLCFD